MPYDYNKFEEKDKEGFAILQRACLQRDRVEESLKELSKLHQLYEEDNSQINNNLILSEYKLKLKFFEESKEIFHKALDNNKIHRNENITAIRNFKSHTVQCITVLKQQIAEQEEIANLANIQAASLEANNQLLQLEQEKIQPLTRVDYIEKEAVKAYNAQDKDILEFIRTIASLQEEAEKSKAITKKEANQILKTINELMSSPENIANAAIHTKLINLVEKFEKKAKKNNKISKILKELKKFTNETLPSLASRGKNFISTLFYKYHEHQYKNKMDIFNAAIKEAGQQMFATQKNAAEITDALLPTLKESDIQKLHTNIYNAAQALHEAIGLQLTHINVLNNTMSATAQEDKTTLSNLDKEITKLELKKNVAALNARSDPKKLSEFKEYTNKLLDAKAYREKIETKLIDAQMPEMEIHELKLQITQLQKDILKTMKNLTKNPENADLDIMTKEKGLLTGYEKTLSGLKQEKEKIEKFKPTNPEVNSPKKPRFSV